MADARNDPIRRFEDELRRAVEAGEPFQGTRCVLSTVEGQRPSARYVLVKGVRKGRFFLFTNYNSRKAKAMARNGAVCLTWHWHLTGVQVRVEGTAERMECGDSEAYFSSRPRGSQVGAWASPQSEAIESREELERRVQEVDKRFEGKDIPCPPHWGGYWVQPSRVEFWYEGDYRLHDRFEYVRHGSETWGMTRLAP